MLAASSLTEAFGEMAHSFESDHPGTRVILSFGASSQLRLQLMEGARADVFASADEAQIDQARRAGVIEGDPRAFAHNRLVVITPRSNPAGIHSFRDLARAGVKIVTSQPSVPVGSYTREAIARASQDPSYGADFETRVEANVVSREDNVRQVVSKVRLGEADAAVVYASDVTPGVRDDLAVVEIPDAFNVLAVYPIAVVRGPNRSGGLAFVDYVLSPAGQRILQDWGLLPAAGAHL